MVPPWWSGLRRQGRCTNGCTSSTSVVRASSARRTDISSPHSASPKSSNAASVATYVLDETEYSAPACVSTTASDARASGRRTRASSPPANRYLGGRREPSLLFKTPVDGSSSQRSETSALGSLGAAPDQGWGEPSRRQWPFN